MALPESVRRQINNMFGATKASPAELLERNRSRLRVCAAVFDGLQYAKKEGDIGRYGDVLQQVCEYITETYTEMDRLKIQLHEAHMKLMKQEAKLSGLRVALAHTQNYAKSAVKQKKAAAEKTLANLEKFVAAELKKSEVEE